MDFCVFVFFVSLQKKNVRYNIRTLTSILNACPTSVTGAQSLHEKSLALRLRRPPRKNVKQSFMAIRYTESCHGDSASQNKSEQPRTA